jgi:hypothetical protein
VLTGWGLQGTNNDSAPLPIIFQFKAWHHDGGAKTVLGHQFGPGQGQAEGEALLDMLAAHPSTARHIALKLCRRFISDAPPPKLVEEVAQAFTRSGGDIRATLQALLHSEEFFEPRYYRARFKTPLEFSASALRAVDAEARGFEPLNQYLDASGMPLYTCPPPTGYGTSQAEWLSPSSLLGRANWAWKLCERPYGGWLRFDPATLVPGGPEQEPAGIVDQAGLSLQQAPLSAASRQAILERMADPAVAQVKLGKNRYGADLKQVLALVLASPDFQRK